ncbi:MAG: sigma-70 family RNA polymerase sigma factor, partial [Planctomycetaceae bacterium]|nr:sigma-70 family RNA polymerase sigma factor [Planctomycetaceae bacterium]
LNFLRFRANAIQSALKPRRPAPTRVAEMQRLLQDAEQVRTELAQANLRLITSIAARLSTSRDEFEEAVSEGNRILMYAIDRFDFSRGYRFSTYLTHAVQRHLYRYLGKRRRQTRQEIATEPLQLHDRLTFEPVLLPASAEEKKQATQAVLAKIDVVLDERERYIVRGRFGLDGTDKAKPYRVLAEHLGLSKERVRQLLQQALGKLGEIAEPFHSILASP